MKRNSFAIFFITFLITGCDQSELSEGANTDWAHYLGSPSSNQYSNLDQINKDNVRNLKVAWTYDTADNGHYQVNNLIVDGVLYTTSPLSRLSALNAATGELIWTFDPSDVHGPLAELIPRGVMHWKDGDKGRILTMKGSYLYTIDAATGQLVASFGEGGWIHLGDELDVAGRPNAYLNTPGHIFKNMFIIGTNVGEDVPGAIRAFNLKTGKREWIFHSLPRPGEPGSETWPENYLDKAGGASDWSGIAIDVPREIVYVSTETAGPDFYGADRYGENLFANSIVALNANTGERLWHQQLVHHDLWDLDLPTPPTLLTVNKDGKNIDIVAQGTKMGLLFVFDRVTGEPLWPIEERPAPKSKIEGIKTWPTQPFPTKPPALTRQKYTENDISNISTSAELITKNVLDELGSYGSYPPPSTKQTIIFPGYDGGMEWGGSAADPEGILYVNVNEIPWFYQLVPTKNPDGSSLSYGESFYRISCAACHGTDRKGSPSDGFPNLTNISDRLNQDQLKNLITNGIGRMPAFSHLPDMRQDAIIDFLFGKETDNTPGQFDFTIPVPKINNEEDTSNEEKPSLSYFCSSCDLVPYTFRGFQRFNDNEGYPAIKPPWGTLNAVDLNTGTIKWKVPLGEYEELTNKGIPVTGTENYGGPVVTAGGIIFIGASSDEKFRVFDKDNGEILWEHDLPFDGHSTPSTYSVDGKQYVVISAGGSKMKNVQGGMLIAFTLDD